MPTISVSIATASFWPSTEELAARDRIMAELDTLSFGSNIGCGGGRGAVDFSYRVSDSTQAEEIIQRVIREHVPTTTPEIRITA